MALSLEDQAGRDQLQTLKHIVVVMMENRSFDHMLGYLKRDGMAEVEGLVGNEWNLDKKGRRVAVTPFDAEAHAVQPRGEALQKKLDPDHSPTGVRIQLGPGYGKDGHNKGFVRSFIESRNPKDKSARSSGWCRWATTPPRTCRCTTTSRASTACATAGTARSRATRGRTE